MKKGVLLFSILIILFLGIASAANDTVSDRGYNCLDSKINSKCSTLTLEELSFSVLATGKCKSDLKNLSLNNECWPSSNCQIRETALALLSLKKTGDNVNKISDWLLNKTLPSQLEWYLEVESNQAASCTINYDTSNIALTIDENRKVTMNSDSCLSLANDNYWLRIANSCLDKNFTVSCDKDFLSTILYKKPSSNVWYVSTDVKSATASGTTNHKINAYCLSTSSVCNYEDNLWAAFALQSLGKNINPMIPYLLAFAEDNLKYFPDSFLYYLTGYTENLDSILSLQSSEGYWNINSKFYDTALGIIFLSDSIGAKNKAKNWLSLSTVQGADGCWNSGNIRDTAFILAAAWPRTITSSSTTTTISCTSSGYYCIFSIECSDNNGLQLTNFDCSGSGVNKICCDKPAIVQTCSDLAGTVCPSDKVCSGASTTINNQECCRGTCETGTTQTDCDLAGTGYSCKSLCSSNEVQDSTKSCNGGEKCCKPSTVTPPTTQTKSYWWVWLLIILIILVILGIIFRNRIRLLFFKSKGEVSKSRPFFPPFSPAPRPMLRPMPNKYPYPAPKSQAKETKPSAKDELDDTLKKLREMSK